MLKQDGGAAYLKASDKFKNDALARMASKKSKKFKKAMKNKKPEEKKKKTGAFLRGLADFLED